MIGARQFKIRRVNGRLISSCASDLLAVEEPLEIRVDSVPVAVTMRTPGHDEELAAGFLYSEKMITESGQILGIRENARNREGNSIDFFLVSCTSRAPVQSPRRFVINSSCGLCGKASIHEVLRRCPPFRTVAIPKRKTIQNLAEQLSDSQKVFSATGGLHGVALFSMGGKLLVAREDVGRHNAVDKVIGWALLEKRSNQRNILMVSGRISFEIVQKALNARIPVIAGISAPTSLAVELARKSRLTLIGFARGQCFNVYAGKIR
ncbi:MAG: formate dehydrogenase family accessory protein FdhD [Verrucomicrobiales bacterium]|nr:formate dehydrogenase family accessory protein FdhD [Verrucomicrobiales bacterium]